MTGRSTRQLLPVALVVLALAACGDDATETSTGSDPDSASGAPAGDTESDAPEPDDDGSTPPADGTGTIVTIGETVYELDEENNCFSTEVGGMTAAFADGSGVDADFNLPPLDWETSTEPWEPPGVGLRDTSADGRKNFVSSVRLADSYPGTDAEQALVTDYEFGVGWASGSGLVIDTQALVQADQDGTAPPELVPFTFQVVCAP